LTGVDSINPNLINFTVIELMSRIQGPQGDTGPRGFSGSRGPAGADGVDGADGDTGPQGDTGAAGSTILSGDTSAAGGVDPTKNRLFLMPLVRKNNLKCKAVNERCRNMSYFFHWR